MNTFFILFPGQKVLQSIWYLFSDNSKHFIMRGPEHYIPRHNYDFIDYILMSLRLYLFYQVGLLSTYFILTTHNFIYFINIFPDHELYETKQNHYDGINWCKLQICNSGNFNAIYIFFPEKYMIDTFNFLNASITV